MLLYNVQFAKLITTWKSWRMSIRPWLAKETKPSAQLNAALHCTALKRAQVRYPAQKIECVKQHEEDWGVCSRVFPTLSSFIRSSSAFRFGDTDCFQDVRSFLRQTVEDCDAMLMPWRCSETVGAARSSRVALGNSKAGWYWYQSSASICYMSSIASAGAKEWPTNLMLLGISNCIWKKLKPPDQLGLFHILVKSATVHPFQTSWVCWAKKKPAAFRKNPRILSISIYLNYLSSILIVWFEWFDLAIQELFSTCTSMLCPSPAMNWVLSTRWIQTMKEKHPERKAFTLCLQGVFSKNY